MYVLYLHTYIRYADDIEGTGSLPNRTAAGNRHVQTSLSVEVAVVHVFESVTQRRIYLKNIYRHTHAKLPQWRQNGQHSGETDNRVSR